MFTGIIEEIGTVRELRSRGDGMELTVACKTVLDDLNVDNSIAIDGVCQTVTERTDSGFTVFAMTETLKKTTFREFKPGRRINLERALPVNGRLGGHLVQGHVDCTAKVDKIVPRPNTRLISLRLPAQWEKLAVLHGSITINGISLTIARKTGIRVTVSVIPFTLEATTLGDLRTGATVNIETDIIGKYLHAFTSKEHA